MAHSPSPTLGSHRDYHVTPGDELEPQPTALELADEPLSGYEQAGARGANPRRHEGWDDELLRKGAIHDGDWCMVEHVDIAGVDRDGTLTGEVHLRRNPYHDAEVVPLAEVAVPDDQYVQHLNRTRWNPTTKVPAHYEEELDRRQAIIDSCPIDVYCSSISQAWGWPHKLQSYYEARPGAAETCDTLMVDSGFNRWGSPDDVLAAAANVDADYVFATDVTGQEIPYSCPVSYCSEKGHDEAALREHITDADGRHDGLDGHALPDDLERDLVTRGHNLDRPTPSDPGIDDWQDAALEGIRRFIDRARELGICDRVILPLQQPYGEFLDACEARGWLDDVNYVALGGMLAIPDVQDRIDALHLVHDRVDEDTNIHALAPGTDPEMLKELRAHPHLLDSLDVSTPEQAPGKNKVPDASWQQDKHLFPFGEHASTVRCAFSVGIALQLTQMLSPLCNAERTFGEVLEDDSTTDTVDDTDDADPQAAISEWASSD